MIGLNFLLPVTDPFLVFSVILLIALLVPILLHKTRTPSIIGLIIIGIIIGPNAFNIIGNNDIVKLFSKVGLLYIMFLAGLEIEFTEFRKNSLKSIVFGILTFIVPFTMGYYLSVYLLSLSKMVSVLIGILLASNTLIAFPTAKKLSISRTPSVNTAISGTVIADTLVLVVLAFFSAVTISGKDIFSSIGIFIVSFSLLLVLVFWGVPKISKWFFNSIPVDAQSQFLFVISILFISSFAAEITGAEPIIGAFFAGLALNRVIPRSSHLMSYIDLVGNALFIPVFLISVGMIVDLASIFDDYIILVYAALLIIVAITGKLIPAWITRLLFRLSVNEMYTIFGLTTARAAAALAIALVGFNYRLINKELFNAVILLILVSSLISSVITERFGRKLALDETDQGFNETGPYTERFLVPAANPDTLPRLIEMAVYLRSPATKEPLFSLNVKKNDLEQNKALTDTLEKVSSYAGTVGVQLERLYRTDVSVHHAIINASNDLGVTKVILGWSGRSIEMNKLFGNILDALLKGVKIEVMVCNLPHPLNTVEEVRVFVPENAENETGFGFWLISLINLNRQLSSRLSVYASENTKKAIYEVLNTKNLKPNIKWFGMVNIQDFIKPDKSPRSVLYFLVSSRPQYISFKMPLWKLTYYIPEHMKNKNFLITYPCQG